MDNYVLWAFLLGALSAISLLIGSLIGVFFRVPKQIVGIMAAFGAGALLSALSIELVAPTIQEFVSAETPILKEEGRQHFFNMIFGAFFGGVLFVILDQVLNQKGGYLRKTAYLISKNAFEKEKFHSEILLDLSKNPLFFKLDPVSMNEIIKHFKPRIYNAEEIIFNSGDKPERMFFIRKGQVAVESMEKNILLEKGQIVGEMSLLSKELHSSDCYAKTDVELLVMDLHDFELTCKLVPEFEKSILSLAKNRLEDNISAITHNAEEREKWANQAIDAINHGANIPTKHFLTGKHKTHNNAAFAIWLGILLDGIPESFVIGTILVAAVSLQIQSGIEPNFFSVLPYTLVAGLFLSNLPEALSSSAQMKEQNMKVSKILTLWSSLVLLTAFGAGLGAFAGEHISHGTLIFFEGIAAGAMLTMICAAMLPEASHLTNANLVGLSTLMGFLSSILFKLLE